MWEEQIGVFFVKGERNPIGASRCVSQRLKDTLKVVDVNAESLGGRGGALGEKGEERGEGFSVVCPRRRENWCPVVVEQFAGFGVRVNCLAGCRVNDSARERSLLC